MRRRLAAVAILVPDYDAAIAHYLGDLGFALIEDSDLGGGKRWVLVAPRPDAETRLLLARAATPEQAAAIGAQAGGRVFLFLETDDFAGDHARLTARGVVFEEAPRREAYGTVAVFRDAFGNRWDLIGPAG
jgi:catechol 2,3-dioxygenase-like lactoylglutathione lyase family enzyme